MKLRISANNTKHHHSSYLLIGIGVGAGKFLGVRRISARISPNFPEKCWAIFVRILSRVDCFWDDLQKKLLMSFCTRWAPFFSNQEFQGFCEDFEGFHRFCPDFRRFFPDFQGFFPDFHQIKIFWGVLAPLHPRLVHYCR